MGVESMATLRELKDRGDQIIFYCRADVARCTHSWEPSWDQLIQYFGPDADFTHDRSEFGRLVCENCGGRGAKIIVQPPEGTTGRGGFGLPRNLVTFTSLYADV